MSSAKISGASPYADLPGSAFWRTAVAEGNPFVSDDIYCPDWQLTPDTPVMTIGSCFAQHIGSSLKAAGFNVLDCEPGPRATPAEVLTRFGYGQYSARYGNVYTLRQTRQLLEEVTDVFVPQDAVWEKNNRFFDALRPAVEPEGLPSVGDVLAMRQQHLSAVAKAISSAEVVVLTLGLTERWEHIESGTTYPTAPGTIAGSFDPEAYQLVNDDYAAILDDFRAIHALVSEANPEMRWIITVSPVPLTATGTGGHVLPATVHSKSILRAVAGTLANEYDKIDYFPSYELVTHIPGGFADNQRSVHPDRIAQVMKVFLTAHGADVTQKHTAHLTSDDGVLCEDILLEAFRP